MAKKKGKPASSGTPASATDRATGRAGEPVARRYPTSRDASGAVTGHVRVAAMVEGKLRETEGEAGVKGLPALLAKPDTAVCR